MSVQTEHYPASWVQYQHPRRQPLLYTASYFEPQRHHGKLISISRSIPKNFRVHGCLEFFIPSADLLRDWKAKRIG